QVVHRHDKGNARAKRATVGRTVQHVTTACTGAERERIPDGVPRQIPCAGAAAEREPADDDVLATGELAAEPVDVARRTRARLRKRGDVEAYGESHSASA